MSNKYEITGKIIAIADTQTFASGFAKREFVIETNEEKYPQKVKLEAAKESCAKLDTYEIGDAVSVQFNIRGNEYNGKYYVNLQAWKFERIGEDRAERQVAPTQSEPTQAPSNTPDDEEIPF